MNYDWLFFAGGAHYAFPNALTFFLAALAGAAARRKNGRCLLALALGLAIGVASWILILHDFRPGGAGDEAELFFQCALGAVGGSFGAAVDKARRKRSDVEASGGETKKAISSAEKNA